MKTIYGYIYKATYLPTGKIYIGKTTLSIAARWKAHCSLAKKPSSSYLHRAIRLHGADCFTCEKVTFAFSENRLNFLERHWIAKTRSAHPFGYNLQSGGEGGKHHAVTKRKIAKALKAACARPDIIENRAKTCASFEYRKKLSKSITTAWLDTALREKKSKRMKEIWKDAEYRANQERMWKDSRFLRQQARRTCEQWKNIDDVEEFKIKLKAVWDRPGHRERMKSLRKAEWEVPEFKRKMITAFRSPKTRKKKSVASKSHWSVLGARERYSAAMRSAHAKKRSEQEATS